MNYFLFTHKKLHLKINLENISLIFLIFSMFFQKKRDFYSATSEPLSGRILRILGMIIIVFIILSKLVKKQTFIIYTKFITFYIFYILLAVPSLFAAPKEIFLITLWKFFELIFSIFFFFYILNSNSYDKFKLIFLSIFIINIIAFFNIFIPNSRVYGIGILPMLYPKFPVINPNTLGFLSTLSILFLTFNFLNFNKPSLKLLLYFISIFNFIFAQSRTSIVALSLSLLLGISYNKKNLIIKSFSIFMTIILIFLFFSASYYPELFYKIHINKTLLEYVLRGQELGKGSFTTFSGRKIMWQEALKYVKENPLIGNFYYGTRVFIRKYLNWSDLSSLHGGYIESFFNSGVLGGLSFCLFIISTFIYSLKISKLFKKEFFTINLAFIVRLFFSSSPLTYFGFETLFFLSYMAFLVKLEKEAFHN